MNIRKFLTKRIAMAAVMAIAVASVALSGAAGMLGSGEAQANGDGSDAYFIQFDGLRGSVVGGSYDGWSEISSFNQAIVRPNGDMTGRAQGRGDVKLNDIVVTKELGSTMPLLAEAILKGTVFPKVEIHLTASYGEAGRVAYYAYEMANVRVVSYNINGDANGNGVPEVEMALNFEQITTIYTEIGPDGSPKDQTVFGWDVIGAQPALSGGKSAR